VSPGFDGNDTSAIASIFSSNVRNWPPDGDVRIGGIALGCGLELIDFHTIPGSIVAFSFTQFVSGFLYFNVTSGALIPRRSTAHREGRRISVV
jgi:hypothetical protein